MHVRADGWWKKAVFYELYIDKFAGDLRTLTERLDYFAALGVTCVHVLPHYPSPMVDDGYDVSDYRNVRPELGTLEDFARFVSEAHARGIYVMIDLVLNHVSDVHPWFVDACSSPTSTYRDFFLWSPTGTEYADALNPFAEFKQRNWIWNEAAGTYYFATFYPQQPDLNWRNPDVLDAISDIMRFWVDLGVDGFRLDAVPHLIKQEGTTCHNLPEVHTVVKSLRARLDAYQPNVVLLAEVQDVSDVARTYFGDGDECHLVYNFPMVAPLILAALHGEERVDPYTLRTLVPAVPEDCAWAMFLRNHDALVFTWLAPAEKAHFAALVDPEGTNAFRGDRAVSLRLANVFGAEKEKLRRAHDLLFLCPGAVVLYYGQEIAMENDRTLGEQLDTRRYVRGVFDWDRAQRDIQNPASLCAHIAQLAHARVHKNPPE